MKDLLDLLKEEQGNESDYVFARRLGVATSTWQMTRTGERKIGLTIIMATGNNLPRVYRQSYYYDRRR